MLFGFLNDAHMEEELHPCIFIASSSSSCSSGSPPGARLHRASRVHHRAPRGARRPPAAQPAALPGAVRVPAAARARAGVRHAVPDEAHRGARALLHPSRAHRQ